MGAIRDTENLKSKDVQVTTNSLPPLDDVEKLGRDRPAAFASAWREFCFCFSILFSVFMADYFIAGFHTVLPVLTVSLNIPLSSRTWSSNVLPLVTGAFLLPFSRFGDIYGGHTLFNLGYFWFTVWSLIAGFSNNYTMLIFCRAMVGLGAAAFLPAGITLLGRMYRPGPRKNFVFGMYGATCSLGFIVGMFMGGLTYEIMSWRWYFWIGAVACVMGLVISLVSIPRDFQETRKMGIKMDWWGAITTVSGLLLVVYAITDSSQAPHGWATWYIYTTLTAGIILLCAAVYIEGWVATAPLIPGDIFKVKYMKRMMVCLFLIYGVFGLYLFYANFYIELVIGISPFMTSIWFGPWAAGGIFLASISGQLLHVIPGRGLLIMCGTSKIIAVLLFAIMPASPNYWAWVFPAMLAETICIDVVYTVTNVFITTSLPSHRQGLAGALINCTIFLGIALFLGVADVAVEKTAYMGLAGSYKVAFWIGVGSAAICLLVFATMNIGFAKSDLTTDEKIILEGITLQDTLKDETGA